VDRTGKTEPVDPGWPSAAFDFPALSPDEQRLALSITGRDGNEQVWVKELPDNALNRLTADEGRSRRPVWSLDGRSVAYITNDGGRTHARRTAADGSTVGGFEVLLEREAPVHEVVFTPDGQGLVFREGNSDAGEADLGYLDLSRGTVEEGLLASEFNERQVALSPDGQWLAYTSNHTGRDEVYVRPFPSVSSGLWPVSNTGGREPAWAHNGRELLYRDGDGWMVAATYSAGSVFAVENRERLFDSRPFLSSTSYRRWDVSRSDDRFVMVLRAVSNYESDEAAGPRLIQIQNFFTELKERVGGGR
jgi:Tol biopolymer transport system component